MPTLLEHIVSRRLFQEYENVATEALAFIVHHDAAARLALTKLMRAARPELGELAFSTQEEVGDIRPDMAGLGSEGTRQLFIENKFWAGLTEGQPVAYLEALHDQAASTLLAFIVPDARANSVWRELTRRVQEASTLEEIPPPAGFARLAETGIGPRLALTSWRQVLDALEAGIDGDKERSSDLDQLRGLCDRADQESFLPLGVEELTDQHIPKRILQYSDIAERALELARERGVVSTQGLRATPSWHGPGRYVQFGDRQGVGAWVGVNALNWRTRGRTPLWVHFSSGSFGRSEDVGPLLRTWSQQSQREVVDKTTEVWVGLDLPAGCEWDEVVDDVLEQIVTIGKLLDGIPRQGRVTLPKDAEE